MTRTIANLLEHLHLHPVPGFALSWSWVSWRSMHSERPGEAGSGARNGYEFKYTEVEHALAMCVEGREVVRRASAGARLVTCCRKKVEAFIWCSLTGSRAEGVMVPGRT